MANKLTPTEQFKHINDGYFYRGMVINTFTTLERNMEMILTDHFVVGNDGDLKNQFVMVLLDRMTFESKRTSLRSLNEKKETDKNFVKTKNNSYPNSLLFEEIRLLQEIRNNFAHFTIAIPDEETNSIIGLAGMRDKVDVVWYSDLEIQKINSRILKAADDLVKLFQ